MLDLYNREISYLRVSVTDRCNLRCRYCMPESGMKFIDPDDILSPDEIVNVIKACIPYGIVNVRLTGGEPLLRKDIVSLIKKIAAIDGLNDLSMTTNGVLLEELAEDLANAGLKRVNVSLDSVDRDKYIEITGRDMLFKVIRGIEAAQNAGLYPVKINCVILKDDDPSVASEVRKFANKRNLSIRFIKEMNLKKGEFYNVSNAIGGICNVCNRIRIMANGMIKPCLFSDLSYSIRDMGIEEAILKAVLNKPLKGTFNRNEEFYSIGG